jgi:predicted nucleic acid-binding protein
MPEIIVIADTSCLIALSRIDALGLLCRLYRRVVVTEDIRDEYEEPLPVWIEVAPVEDVKYQRLLEVFLDKGESSAIALAVTLENALLILDDLKGRKEAKRLGFKITDAGRIVCRQTKRLNLCTEAIYRMPASRRFQDLPFNRRRTAFIKRRKWRLIFPVFTLDY